jgi:hypothetical protein
MRRDPSVDLGCGVARLGASSGPRFMKIFQGMVSGTRHFEMDDYRELAGNSV